MTARRTLSRLALATAAALALAAAASPALATGAEPAFTTEFDLDRCHWVSHGRDNPFFSLHPGDQVTLRGEDDGELVVVQITVKQGTRTIRFTDAAGQAHTVKARVVEEREWIDGELFEVSRNWFARCRETGDVFYFGERVDNYEDGEIVDHDGSWEAGVRGALPGIIMPGRYLLGARYYQEIAEADEALDRAENRLMNLTVEAAGETLHGCVEIVETSPLEPGAESVKRYCPGVGMVADGEIELEEYVRAD